MQGTTLKKIRLYYGFTQQELADKLGVTRGYLSQLERGLKPVSLRVQVKLAKYTAPKPELIDTLDQLKNLTQLEKSS
ncbi:helix-turn-helix transcriptional regulator [Heyndrickxia coagulans]|uniref:helix-turn-helix domain-containing protein n=1 Tax=Heyndrickxia coagulans TaxID=1398 RepID=UPI002EBDF6E4|nr:helix-turn-helix transcriptional regulator [Heyndrickxia coagulans]